MADDQQQRPTEAGGERDVHEHEDEARRRRTGAERERAADERADEEPGRGSADEDRVLPTDADDERRGVMPPRSE
jgi:hypothetical protein